MSKTNLIASTAFVGVLAIGGILIFATPDRSFSANENRYLTKKPALAVSTVLSGDFQDGLEEYMSDQFLGRDALMATATRLQHLSGKNTVNDTFIGKKDYLFERKTDEVMAATKYSQNLTFVSDFINTYNHIPMQFMLVPSPATILSEYLPAAADEYDAEAYYEQALSLLPDNTLLDIRNLFSQHLDDYIFYRTDHHWTSYGAYLAYTAYAEAVGLTPRSVEDFSFETVTDSFLGTLYSKVPGIGVKADSISLTKVLPEMTITTDKGSFESPYFMEQLSEKDKYTVFFDGNFGQITCKLKNSTGKRLLVIKDSFANSLVPMLMQDYDEIIMVDLRYYTGNISELMTAEGFSDVLILYEMTHFAEDTNMIKLSW